MAARFLSLPGLVMSTGGSLPDDAAEAAFPGKSSGSVRGKNSPGCGWLLEPIFEGEGEARKVVGTVLHYIIHSDIKGWVPAMVINRALSSNYESFFGALEKHMQAL